MPVWNVCDISAQPHLRLASWRIFEIQNGDRHFVGYNIDDGEGRVSSAICSFDPHLMRGVTASGRIYMLIDAPGYDADADYVWAVWSRINQVEEYRDVTQEVLVAT